MSKIPVWHAEPAAKLIELLNSNSSAGLTAAEAKSRLTKYGPNRLKEPDQKPWYLALLAELNDYLIFILIAGAVLSISLGEVVDGVLILTIIAAMAGLGYFQNRKAEEALASLKKMVIDSTTVIRDGKKITLESSGLVPGDIVTLKAGDSVPADLRIIEAHNCTTDESTLTGESLPVTKFSKVLDAALPLAERRNMAYSGTLVLSGRLIGVVVSTGMATELGAIATLLESTTVESTPLEIQLDKLGRVIGTTLLGIVTIVFAVDIAKGASWLDSGIESIALAVAAVPEGLPAVITLCLAFGTKEMVKRKALVRRLKAVEALGSVSIVATDKTGTITKGQMSVTKVWDVNGDVRDMLLAAHLCNNNADMTEKALTAWAQESKIELKDYPRVVEHEFNSLLKRMAVVNQWSKSRFLVSVKGAPEMLIERCRLTPELEKKFHTHLTNMTSRGLRVIALARKLVNKNEVGADRDLLESNLELLGLIGLSDPPKAEVKEALSATRRAGITPVMITGDNPETARAIAKEVGFGNIKPITGNRIDQLVAAGDTHTLTHSTVFARVSPEHKTIILKAFQQEGHLVAMIGDGVNDAPSIKLANVGVSMGIRGSDVTKGAADLVLLDDNYSTLVAAIEEGRNILNRIRRFVSYLLSCNIAEVGIFLVSALLGIPFPLTPAMLLLLNIVTDAAPALAMAVEPGNPRMMTKPPRDQNEPIITPSMWLNIGILTLVTIPPVIYSYQLGGTTMAFATLSFLELFRAYTARALTLPLSEIGFFRNRWTTPAVLFGVAVTLLVIYLGGPIFKTTPLPLPYLALSLLLALVGPVTEELTKPLIRRFQNPTALSPK